MVTAASTILASVARRVRDENNTAHSASFILDLLDRLQVLVNGQQQAVTTTRSFTNTANKTLYTFENDLQGIIDLQTVRIGGQRLDEITPWQNLYKLSATWLTDRGDPAGYARIGRTLVALWPTPPSDITIDFQGSAITAPLTSNSVDLELSLEDEDIARELLTALLLMRQRDLDSVEGVIKRLTMKLEVQSGKGRRANPRQ